MKPVTIRRWEIVGAFVLLTTAFVVVLIMLTSDVNSNHRTLKALSRDKASIVSLERTNCRIREFLLSSAALRDRLAKVEPTATKRRADEHAAKVSRDLARSFANQRCSG